MQPLQSRAQQPRDARSNSQPHLALLRVSPPQPQPQPPPSQPPPAPYHPSTFSLSSPAQHSFVSPHQPPPFLYSPSAFSQPSTIDEVEAGGGAGPPSLPSLPSPLLQRSPPQPVPRLSMQHAPAVNYSDSYTFPPQSAAPSASTPPAPLSQSVGSLPSAACSSLPQLQTASSPSSARVADGAASPQPHPAYGPLSSAWFSPAQADRLDSLRPDALQLPKSSTSPVSLMPHSVSLPTLPPPSSSQLFTPPHHSASVDAEFRSLDSAIGVLQMLMQQSEGGQLSEARLRKHLQGVVEQLCSVRSSSIFRSTSIHNALFQTLALRRSTSETMADQEVVDWISHEYLTPRRGSTSSDGGAGSGSSGSSNALFPHSLSQAAALQAQQPAASHSLLLQHLPHHDELRGGHRHRQAAHRSNSVSGVTMRSGSFLSLDTLPATQEADSSPVGLVRATKLLRIIKRLSATGRLRSQSKQSMEEIDEREEVKEREEKEAKALSPRARQPPLQSSRRKSHLDLPTSTSPLVLSSAANISAPFNPNAPSAIARSPSSRKHRQQQQLQDAVSRSPAASAGPSPSAPRSVSGSQQRTSASASASSPAPLAAGSPSSRKPLQPLFSPSSSPPSPRQSSPSSASAAASKSLSRSRSSSNTPSSARSGSSAGPLYSGLLDRMLSDPVHSLLMQADDWSFDIFAFHSVAGSRTLSCLLCHLFDQLGVFERFSVRRETFAAFIGAIEDGYESSVPYHNAIHAADVLLNTAFLLQTGLFASCVTALDVFASLIAAAVHDYAHPGTNNAYQIATGSEFAIRYNDLCVLESMHCSEAFFVLRRPDCNILESLQPAARAELRSTVIHQVLATDMQQHFKNLAELKAEMEKKK